MKLTYGITTLDTKTLDKSEFSQLMTERLKVFIRASWKR